MPELDLGGGYGIAYTTQHTPLPPAELAQQMAEIVRREVTSLGIDAPRVSIEPGRAIAGPSTFTLYEVGTVKPVQVDRGATRLYVSVDGGMSDNIRTARRGGARRRGPAGRAPRDRRGSPRPGRRRRLIDIRDVRVPYVGQTAAATTRPVETEGDDHAARGCSSASRTTGRVLEPRPDRRTT